MAEQNNAAFIWSIANLLRGTYKQADYGKVILPFTVLRRLDSALEATKVAVLDTFEIQGDKPAADFLLQQASGYSFYNTSPYDLKRAAGDTGNLRANLVAYIEGFSPNVRDIFERYDFTAQLNKLDENDLLLLVTQKFSQIDLHPETVSNVEMGLIFEELIRKFAEASNETAGEHFTPRDVVRLIVNLLFATDDEILSKPGVVRSVYDPTAGTGGMLSVADDYIRHLNPEASLTLFGQELNGESYAIAKADMVIKGQDIENMVWGDTLTNDGHHGKHFDYCLANPPFGVEWKKQQSFVEREHLDRGFDGRFGPGTPRVSDGSLLFLLHLVKKMRPVTKEGGGGRIGIVLNGSPLFTGAAGSGESEIRKYLLEQDLVEAIIGLPKDMFYNTGIATYIWILSNHKPVERRGKVQLIDATSQFEKLRKNLGDKRAEISQANLENIVRTYHEFEETETSKIFKTTDFGYTTITVEQPLRLSWAITPERIEAALAAKAFEKLSAGDRIQLEEALAAETALDAASTTNSTEFAKRVQKAVAGLGLNASQIKNLVAGLAEHDDDAPLVRDAKGKLVADAALRDTENVPLSVDIDDYIAQEIAPHLPDFWLDRSKDKVGYEIPFTRHFYKYEAPRPLEEIDADLNKLIAEISQLLIEIEK
ncbi:type I restriction-modification system subunit M [Rhodoluna limnophila]|uniref:type I restriction-modification system subunit M n=1 Tax=Rhodoluna limnophila TaxID=232537 RepID=UPI0011069CAA|nr:class I SAM-dependent DNA methyltransferase [Rhodoluna limnophila]